MLKHVRIGVRVIEHPLVIGARHISIVAIGRHDIESNHLYFLTLIFVSRDAYHSIAENLEQSQPCRLG